MSGRAARLLRDGNDDAALAEVKRLAELLGPENVFVELQDAGLPEQRELLPKLAALAEKAGLRTVATNDVHYLRHEDAHAHDALLCIQTQSNLADEDRMRYGSDEFYLKSGEEMDERFKDYPGACEATVEIAARCDVSLDFGTYLLPSYPVPDGYTEGRTCASCASRASCAATAPSPRPRCASASTSSSASSARWASTPTSSSSGTTSSSPRTTASPSAPAAARPPARSSATRWASPTSTRSSTTCCSSASSIPGARACPTSTWTSAWRAAREVIEYVAQKYGRDRVAQIITFGTMAARAAVRDAARVMGMPYAVGDKIAKMIPEQAPPASFEDAMKPGGELKQAYDADDEVKEVVDLAMSLEGLIRNDSIHAAAVVISDKPLTEYLPLQQKGDAELVTQFDMNDVAKLGLLKMDFLGLRNLDVIEAALAIIEKTDGVCIEIDQLPLDDEKTYKMLAPGDSDRRVPVREPRHARGDARHRPHAVRGPHRHRRPLPSGPHGVHPDLRAQQEGPGLGRLRPRGPAADPGAHLRRDHLPGTVHGHRPPGGRLLAGPGGRPAQGHQQEEQGADGHAQGAAHAGPGRERRARRRSATSSGPASRPPATTRSTRATPPATRIISYRTAWLKANYPVEYMAALISSVMNTKDKVPFYVNQCHELGIEVLPPDVNESDVGFTVVEDKIRFGLNAVKGVGVSAIEAIVAARAAGRFASVYDFCARVDSQMANKRVLEALVRSGAFDSTGDPRRGMLEALPSAMADGERRRKDAAQGQGDLFGGGGEESAAPAPRVPQREFDQAQRLKLEKEVLGLYVSAHPLQGLREQLRDEIEVPVSSLDDVSEGAMLWTGGIVANAQKKVSKNGGVWLAFRLEDIDGGVECRAWPATYEQYKDLLVEDGIVKVKGRLERRNEGESSLIAIEVAAVQRRQRVPPPAITIDARRVRAGVIDDLRRVLADFPGQVPVVLHMVRGDEKARLRVGDGLRVAPVAGLYAELKALLGESCIGVG